MQNRLFRISLTTLGLVLCMNIVSCRAAGQELPHATTAPTGNYRAVITYTGSCGANDVIEGICTAEYN